MIKYSYDFRVVTVFFVRRDISMRKRKCFIVAMLVLAMILSGIAQIGFNVSGAKESIMPLAYDNLGSVTDVDEFAGLVATSTGYVRVFPTYDSETKTMSVYAEDYDADFNLLSRKQIPTELSWYLGFYASKDNYYIVFAQNNTEEDTSKEVYRVVKYDKSWKRLSACSLTGDDAFAHEVRYPFDAASFDIVEQNGKLYFACGHEGYVDPAYNQGHQGLMMCEVDMATMKGGIFDADLWHSFSQDLAADDEGNVYLIEESEGSRATKVTKYTPSNLSYKTVYTLEYGGDRTSAWAIATFATADDIETSTNNVLAVGSSIDQSTYEEASYNSPFTIYLSVTPKDNFTADATTVKWIECSTSNGGFTDVTLVKVSDDKFMLMWETVVAETSLAAVNEYDSLSRHVLHYIILDGNGNQIGSEKKVSAPESTCTPIIKNGKAVFYASDGANIGFYTIDTNTGAFTKKIYSLAGPNAMWTFADGVLTISGSGEIYESFSSKALGAIREKITKIVIKSGITDIPRSAFSSIQNLTEVVIEDGVKTIGDAAFGYNSKLAKVTIPSSVTYIADDAFGTGYYWVGSGKPVVNAKIYCPENSYAEAYARDNGIAIEITSYTPTGPSALPSPSDVSVSYRTHVQTYGWEGTANDISTWKSNGAMSGTSGVAKRLEGINIVVNSEDGKTDIALGVQYTTHCQSYGWLPWSANGEMNGTEGEAKRLEAIKIQLTGADKDNYDIYYRVHAQSYGWLGWAKNGAPAGTAGYGKRLEGIQIVVVDKGASFNQTISGITSARKEAFVAKEGSSPIVNCSPTSNTNPVVPGAENVNVAYRTHVQSYGWQAWKYNGQMSGTSGQAKRLEGINIELRNKDCSGDIVYTTHVQTYGWQGSETDQSKWFKNGQMAGTSGEAKRLEAICINLTGEMSEKYDIYYRVHAQSYGWLGWAKNGAPAGTAGYAKRLEGIQIVLVPKGGATPGNYQGVVSVNQNPYVAK
ncbi:MAG: hypothetical protein E7263_07755 [Lachnospiraceae bacterium]|nr:hypothetical protein [Lachnospiraceae bacterium]